MQVFPLGLGFELGDIPAPDLVGCSGQQLRFFVMVMADMPAALLDITMAVFQDAIHGADRAQVAPLIQQRVVDLIGSFVLKWLRVQQCQHLVALIGAERQRRCRAVSPGLVIAIAVAVK